jgi:PAS domain S-box-containing protein
LLDAEDEDASHVVMTPDGPEAQLLAEAAAFAAILRSSADAVIAKTVDGTVTAWNDGATQVYGYAAADIIGKNIELTFPAADLDDEQERHRRVAAGASESGYRCVRLRSDGRPVEIVMSMSPVRDERGAVIGVASISRAVNAAEQDEARFAALLDAAPDAVICVGPDGRIATLNARATALFGYPRIELLGASVDLILPDAGWGAATSDQLVSMSVRRGRIIDAPGTLRARRRDGTTFPVEMRVGPAGTVEDGLLIAAIRDVTEQRALEAASKENEIRLRQLAESVDIVFVLLQLEPWACLYVTPGGRALLGADPAALFADSQMGLSSVHPDDRDDVEHEYVRPARDGLATSSEHRVIGLDGTVKWVRATATPVANSDDAPPTRTVITIEDISERIQAAEALRAAEAGARAANEAKNVFLSRMSHELRTPLNAVLGFGQLLARRLQGTEDAAALGHILKGGRHLLDLINDVLDIARIESGKMSISTEPVHVCTVIDETLNLMRPLAADAEVTLSAGIGPDSYVMADRQRLRQMLLNLVSNAIKYNHRGGTVWVTYEAGADHTALTVRDDGRGIPLEAQTRMFTPFDRLGAEGSGVDGTGIGLALTRSLAELMQGSIAVVSTPGEGSSFVVSLPTAHSAGVTSSGPSRAPADSGRERRTESQLSLLYIEDNDSNVRVIEHLLRLRPHWRLVHAGLGRLGVDLATAQSPDLVLLDLHLPDGPGHDVLVALKGDRRTAAIPVVILTADARVGQPSQLVDAGAYRFLTKPVDVDEVLTLLDSVTVKAPS